MGGPNFFREERTQGGLVANWALSNEPTLHSVPVTTVYDDPSFVSTAKTKTFGESNRLIDPMEAPKVQEPGDGKREHKYECSQAPQTHLSTSGRWWPVWLVCRTKKGWWAVCWYQLLDGTCVVEIWWYSDVHVHLIDVVR